MKNQKLSTQERFIGLFILFITLGIFACTNTGNKTTQDSTMVKAPATDIHTAAFMGNVAAINQHIAAGTDLNVKDQYGSTPLIITITFGRTEAAKALIEGEADMSIQGSDGSSPLHTASFLCRTEIVKSLLAKGANKEAVNSYGVKPIETVNGPFEQVEPIYMQLNKDLGPLGLKLDLEYLKKTRPEVAQLLK